MSRTPNELLVILTSFSSLNLSHGLAYSYISKADGKAPQRKTKFFALLLRRLLKSRKVARRTIFLPILTL